MDYYNEYHPPAAAMLQAMIDEKIIPAGTVDTRSIIDVRPADLRGFTQCHFFAGVAGWPLALAAAGWDPRRPVWTASCPCQPFSAAGRQKGETDERHLWPVFHALNRDARKLHGVDSVPVCFGEQVASGLGRGWLAGVRSDMEALGDVFGAADLCAAGEGAPHIRQRLFWVAYADGGDSGPEREQCGGQQRFIAENGGLGGLCNTESVRPHRGRLGKEKDTEPAASICRQKKGGRGHDIIHERADDAVDRMGDAMRSRGSAGLSAPARRSEGDAEIINDGGDGRLWSGQERGWVGHNNPRYWDAFDIAHCTDGKARRIPAEPSFFPLAHGIPGRSHLLHGAGNAIVPALAATFIKAFMSIENEKM